MTYCDSYIKTDGARSISIILPCFSGEDDFYEAMEMNRFYRKLQNVIYEFAQKCIVTESRRASFSCNNEIFWDNERITVKLDISFKETGKHTIRKSISHTWIRGKIHTKEIS